MKRLTQFFTLCCESSFRFALRYISAFLLAYSDVKFLLVIYIFPASRWFCLRASNLCQMFSSFLPPSLRVSKMLYHLVLICSICVLIATFHFLFSCIVFLTSMSENLKRTEDGTSILPAKFRKKKWILKKKSRKETPNGKTTIMYLCAYIYIYIYIYIREEER